MLVQIRNSCLAAIVAVFSTATAFAATITDPMLYKDIHTGSSFNFSGFTIAGSASGPATLDIRYGQWNGTTASVDLTFTFNGTALAPALNSTGAYFSNPAYGSYDVSSLVTSGLNTLSVFGTLVSGGPTTYAVGELKLTYNPVAAVPLPATLPLLFAALGGLGLVARRRKDA